MKKIKTNLQTDKLNENHFVSINLIEHGAKVFVMNENNKFFAVGVNGMFDKSNFDLNNVNRHSSISSLCIALFNSFGPIEVYKFKTRKKMFKYLAK